MKRRLLIVAALAASVGLHVFVFGAGRLVRDEPLRPNSHIPDVMRSATIAFPEAPATPVGTVLPN